MIEPKAVVAMVRQAPRAEGAANAEAEIRAYAEQLAKLDDASKLAPLFAAPQGLGAEDAETARAEEGWILGV